MKIRFYKNVKEEPLDSPEASGVKRRVVISEEDGAENFIMRVFEVEPGGYSPYHSHSWEHEVFIKKGSGIIISQGKEFPIKEGDTIFIPGEEDHQFKNTGRGILEFICVVPKIT